MNYSRYAINSLRHQLNTRLALKYSNKITHTLISRFGERSNKVSHIVYDSNLKYQLSENSYFFINVNNIFNEEYYETNLVRRICGLLYISDKDSGIIKTRIHGLSK